LTNLEFKTKNENENKVKKLTWIVETSCEKEADAGTTECEQNANECKEWEKSFVRVKW